MGLIPNFGPEVGLNGFIQLVHRCIILRKKEASKFK